MKEKKLEEIDGYTIKYHANGKTVWSKGKIINGQPEGTGSGTVQKERSSAPAILKKASL